MAKRDRTQFPPLPESLPRPAVDNHTHLDSIIPFWRRAENAGVWQEGGAPSSSMRMPEALIEPSDNAFLDEMLRQAHAVGITRIVQCGCELPTAAWTDEFLRRLDAEPDADDRAQVVGAIAIHPNEAVLHAGISEIAADGLEPRFLPHHRVPLADAIAEIARLAATNPAIRAIGETGLDFFRAGPLGAQAQAESFRAHIALAKELDFALQIHDRNAHQAVVEILLAEGAPERTVFHCFSGDRELAGYVTGPA
ncbi:MAG: TatD family hydrolase, partial [Promicromonosporaceae bacterium]|nr:TatD family hydrolase [Promicromonosporaceae bacterium]